VVLAAAGDIACAPGVPPASGRACEQQATAALIDDLEPDAVLALGDMQYPSGLLGRFQESYDRSWGRFKSITRPAVGNHEYNVRDAAGYYAYFGASAGDPAKGYYSFDLGAWHLIALNSECDQVGGCGAGSPQERWLRADLAAHPAGCTLAYWHQPRFSSGNHGNEEDYDAFWRALYDAGAEIVLSGHDHDYERFAPQNPDGQADHDRGIRQFVVGTGGVNHHGFQAVRPNSEVRNADTFGILELRLEETGYAWRFLPTPGGRFGDTGRESCH
jgi:hypothetical protein